MRKYDRSGRQILFRVHGVHGNTHQSGGVDEISIAGLNGEPVALTAHKDATTGVHGVGSSEVESKAGAQSKVNTHAQNTSVHPSLRGTVSVDPPSIAKQSTTNVDVTVAGLQTTHRVQVQCQSDLENGLVCIAAYCPSNNTLRLRISNVSASAVDGASRTWAYWAW